MLRCLQSRLAEPLGPQLFQAFLKLKIFAKFHRVHCFSSF